MTPMFLFWLKSAEPDFSIQTIVICRKISGIRSWLIDLGVKYIPQNTVAGNSKEVIRYFS